MARSIYYVAAAHWRSPKVIGPDVLHLCLFFGEAPAGLGVEATVKGRVLTEDPRAEDILVAYSSGSSFLRHVRGLLEGSSEQ